MPQLLFGGTDKINAYMH